MASMWSSSNAVRDAPVFGSHLYIKNLKGYHIVTISVQAPFCCRRTPPLLHHHARHELLFPKFFEVRAESPRFSKIETETQQCKQMTENVTILFPSWGSVLPHQQRPVLKSASFNTTPSACNHVPSLRPFFPHTPSFNFCQRFRSILCSNRPIMSFAAWPAAALALVALAALPSPSVCTVSWHSCVLLSRGAVSCWGR